MFKFNFFKTDFVTKKTRNTDNRGQVMNICCIPVGGLSSEFLPVGGISFEYLPAGVDVYRPVGVEVYLPVGVDVYPMSTYL